MMILVEIAMVSIIGVGICLLLGCHESSNPTIIHIVLQGNSPVKNDLEEMIRKNPTVTNPQSKTTYSMMIVKPDTSLDYKIIKVIPYPNIDYKILVIDPKLGTEIPELTEQISNAFRNQFQEELQKRKKANKIRENLRNQINKPKKLGY